MLAELPQEVQEHAAVELGDPQRWSWAEDGLSLFLVSDGTKPVDLTDGTPACTDAARRRLGATSPG